MFPARHAHCRLRRRPGRGHRRRAPPPGRPRRADRLGKLRQPARAGSAGQRADQQVRRRLSGQALLRRLRVRRRRRAAGDRARASSCSAPTTPTCSRTRARRPTRRCTWRCCTPGDTILGMSLAHGGHLTHGAKVNIRGKLFNAVQYGVDANGMIDYDEVETPGARAQAEDAGRRLQRLLAGGRLGAHAPDRRQRSARYCSSTWRTSPAWSPPACIRARCRTRTWSPRPRTRPCAARAAASSLAQGADPRSW